MASSFLLTAVLLVIVDLLVSMINPLMLLNRTGLTGLSSYYVVSKLPQFLSSNRQPDVIMTGSSSFLYPAIRSDDKRANRQTRYDSTYVRDYVDTYSYWNTLESSLSKQLGRSVTVANLATAGGLMSDQYMVLKKCVASGRRPKLLISDISFREFHDNNQLDESTTPVHLVLRGYDSLYENIVRPKSVKAFSEAMLAAASSIFRQKQDYREFATNLSARISGHPTDLFHATAQGKPTSEEGGAKAQSNGSAQDVNRLALDKTKQRETTIMTSPRKNRLVDLPAYRRMYSPANPTNFKKQMTFLRKYLSLASEKKIPVVLVRMPLMAENEAIAPPGLWRKFDGNVQAMAEEYGATLVNPRELASLNPTDFEDTAHLDTTGSFKLVDAIVEPAAKTYDHPSVRTATMQQKSPSL